jgi:quinol monooxygenase YgiN
VTTTPLPDAAVVRVSRGNFDPARFAEVHAMTIATGRYLIPAIRQLPGLISYYAAASPDGSIVHVSIWESDEHAQQMSRLKVMIVDARNDAEKAGVTFLPIVNYPIDWSV